jgi:anthranilate phosphoribosyltransferase
MFDLDIDIYAPCALGATINDASLERLRCSIIAGAANNQLADETIHGLLCQQKGILYAPDFHPAFAGVAEARKLLSAQGKRTAFHLLGPLVNPARPQVRMVGVFREEDMSKMAGAMEILGVESYAIVYGEDEKGVPLGELSPLGRNRVIGKKQGQAFELKEEVPKDWGKAQDLEALGAEESAAKIVAVLAGDGMKAVRGAVIWNAGLMLWLAGMGKDWGEGRSRAEETINKGAARALLERWRTWSRGKLG